MYQIKANGQVFYSPALSDAAYQVISPHLKRAFNKADTLTFILPPDNAMHGKIQKLKSVITAEWDGKEIFRGRVLEEKTDLYNQTAVVCEGELSFLLDSLLRPYKFKGTAEEFLRLMIDQHNAQVDADKQFTVGIVSAVTDEDTFDTESTDYRDTLSEIWSFLIDRYDGYLRVRYENGVRYLDYLDAYNETSNQKIEFGVNLLDIENHINAQDLFTVLVPLSDIEDSNETLTIEKVNNGLDYIENAEAIARYGRIVKRYVWHNVTDPAKLLELGQEKLNNAATLDTLTVKAVDMHLCNVNTDSIDLGVTAHVLSRPHGIDRDLVCSALDVDLQEPEKTEYTFGKPKETMAGSVASNTKRSSRNSSHIKETQYEVSIKVDRDGVIAAINVTPEAITIDAGKINLVGYVTASQLYAETASIRNSISTSIITSSLSAHTVSCTNLSLGGASLRLRTIKYTDADGNAATMVVPVS